MPDDHAPNNLAPKGRRRWLPLALAAVAGVALGGGAYAWKTVGSTSAPAVSGQAAIGGPFQLIDQDGRPANEQLLRGKWTAVFFGYTYCPDFCPTTLNRLQAATELMGKDGRDLQVVMISVDPERDTPAALKSYLEGFSFPGGVQGLTGAPEQVDAAAKAWRVYRRKNGSGDDYLVDHFTGVYLMDPQGRFNTVFTHGLTPEETARLIRAAMEA